MMNRQWIVGLGGVVCLVTATFLSGFIDESRAMMMHGGHEQEDRDDHGGHYLKHLLKHAKEIGLTPEQIGKLKALQLDFKRTEARLEADVKVAKLELHALAEDEQADLNAIQTKVEQLKKADGACLFEAIKSKRSAMALLTPDQREKDRAHHEQMKSETRRGGGMGRGGMGGMGGGMMGGSGQGQSGSDHGSGGSGGGQQHQH